MVESSYIMSPRVKNKVSSILHQTVFNKNKSNHPNCQHSHKIFFKDSKAKWSHWNSFTRWNVFWREYQRQSGGSGYSHHQLATCFFCPFFVVLVLEHTLPSLREYNAMGMIKCCVAGFHLFVYSFSSIILNKLPLEICPVSWDMTVLWGIRRAGSTY